MFFLLQYLAYMLYLKIIIGLKVTNKKLKITEGYYIAAKEEMKLRYGRESNGYS